MGAAFGVSTPAAFAQSYRLVDLGTLGGHASGGYGLNESGRTVGWSIDGTGGYYGFLSDASGQPLTHLGSPPNGTYSYAEDVNDLGIVVGYADVQVGFGVKDRAFRWESGSMIDIGTLGGDASQAFGINASGQITGWANDVNNGKFAFIWEGGSMTQLPGLPGGYPDNEARAISDTGVVVGQSWDANSIRWAVVWENGVLTQQLPLPEGATGARAYGVNEVGQVVGNVWHPGNVTAPVLWENGTATQLDHLPGHRYGLAYDINNSGLIVGATYSGGHLPGGQQQPVLWENGIAFNLAEITDVPTGKSLDSGYQINEAGQIAATGGGSGGFRAYRLDPIPGGLGLTGPDPGYPDQDNVMHVRGATSGSKIYFVYGLIAGSSAVPNCGGLFVQIQNALLGGTATANANGHASFTAYVPPNADGETVLIQAVELSTCRTSNMVSEWF